MANDGFKKCNAKQMHLDIYFPFLSCLVWFCIVLVPNIPDKSYVPTFFFKCINFSAGYLCLSYYQGSAQVKHKLK